MACHLAQAQHVEALVDGASISATGVVLLKNVGNNAYFLLKPAQPYEAVFEETDRRLIREIGLCWDGRWDEIRDLVGEKVTVHGLVQLEPVSPSYFNGTCIRADSIQQQNGVTLVPKKQIATPPPADLIQFHSRVTFTPHSPKRFTYKSWDAEGRQLTQSDAHISCGLNGPGDVMNCYCPEGFDSTGKGTISFSAAETTDSGVAFAQFEIADPVRGSVRHTVECTRTIHHR